MLTTFRKFQKGTLIVVTIIIVIAFAFLYSDFDFAKGTLGTSDCVVKVHNRCYRLEEAQKLAKYQGLAFNLGMGQFAQTLTGLNRTLDRDPTEFVMNMIVLRKAAESLGIEPTTEEIKEAVPKLPFVQMYGLSSENMRNLLGRYGLAEDDLARLVKDYLAFNKIEELIGCGVQAVPAITDKAYIQRNQRYTASVINFDRENFEKAAEVTDEEIKKYYEERNGETKPSVEEEINAIPTSVQGPAADPKVDAPKSAELAPLMTAQKRGFKYVKFIPEKLAEDATNEAKSKSGINFAKQVNRSYSTLAAEEADFDKVAAELAAQENSFSIEAAQFEPFKLEDAPEAISGDDGILSELFSGTLEKGEVTVPFSSGEEGIYYVFQFTESVEPRKMTLEEARPLIEEALKAQKSNLLVSDAANEALAKLQKAIDEKKSILDAASANSLDIKTLPVFSEADRPEEIEDADLILDSVREIGPGQLSKVKERRGGKGYFITYVDKIEIYKDENIESNKRILASNAERSEKTSLFQGWLRQRARESGAARLDSILNYPTRR